MTLRGINSIASAAVILSWTVAGAAERPNILFIMADDHAAHAVGAYGGRLAKLDPTPNIDDIANEGVRLTNCFVTNSICSPARATILTGQYSHRNSVLGFAESLPPDRQTLAHAMHAAGYETAVIGKWHLGDEPAAFDHYAVLPGQGSYFNPIFCTHGDGASFLPQRFRRTLPDDVQPWPNFTFRASAYDNIHADDAITELSLEWLKSRKQTDKPFFLMHHFKGPHDNFENAERYDFLYDEHTIPEPKSLRHRGGHGPKDRPLYGTSVSQRNTRRNMGDHMFVDASLPDDKYTTVAYQRYMKKYLRTVRGVDDNVGRLLAHLKETDQLDETIVVYTSDQGFMLGEHDYIDKRWMYEESLRIPLLVRFPKSFTPGTVAATIVSNVDIAPTLLELAGVTDDALPRDFQGESFVDVLKGKPSTERAEEVYYRYWLHMAHHDNPAHFGIRTADYKLIFFYGLPCDVSGAEQRPTPSHWELYDLTADPYEMQNLAGDPAAAEIFARLKHRLAALRQEVGDTDEHHPEVVRRFETTQP